MTIDENPRPRERSTGLVFADFGAIVVQQSDSFEPRFESSNLGFPVYHSWLSSAGCLVV